MSETVFDNVSSLAGVRYHKALHNSDVMDTAFLRRAREEGIRLPSAGDTERDRFWGAYVADPVAGIHNNVGYLDLSSLYPNNIITLNASPDTIIGTKEELEASDWDESETVHGYIDTREVKVVTQSDDPWGTYINPERYKMIVEEKSGGSRKKRWEDPEGPRYEKCYFIHPDIKEGFITETVRGWIEEKDRYEGKLYAAIKRIVNSSYGTLGDTNFRLFDWRIAECITLTGRKVIQHSAEKAMEFMEDEYDAETFIKMGDTDGAGVCWDDAPDAETAAKALVEAGEYVNSTYDEFMADLCGVDSHTMDVEIESVADTVFVPSSDPMGANSDEGVKKRYGQHLAYDEADRDEEPDIGPLVESDEVSITGLEAKRSDTAPITKSVQLDVLTTLLAEGEDATDEAAKKCRDAYERARDEADVPTIAKRGGIGQKLSEYGSQSRMAGQFARGAKYSNENLGVHLGEGSKPMLIYVDRITTPSLPQTYDAVTGENDREVDVIAVEDYDEIPDGVEVDREKHAEKTVRDPMEPILGTVGVSWSEVVSGQTQTGFDAYVS